MKNKKTLLISALVFFVVAGLAFKLFRKSAPKIIGEVSKGRVVEAVYGIGTVKARHTYDLRVGVTSNIRDLYVVEGDRVKRGDRLANLDGNVFAAPIAGTVIRAPFKVGETVLPQVSILALSDQADRYLEVSLEQQGALRVKIGQLGRISFDSLREKSFDGQVSAVFSNSDQFLVHIQVHDLPPAVLPGMTSDVGIEIASHEDVFLVPAAALSGKNLSVIEGRQIKSLPVDVGFLDGDQAEVKSDQLRVGMKLALGIK